MTIVVSDELPCEDFVALGTYIFWGSERLHRVAIITVKSDGCCQPDDTGGISPDVINGHTGQSVLHVQVLE